MLPPLPPFPTVCEPTSHPRPYLAEQVALRMDDGLACSAFAAGIRSCAIDIDMDTPGPSLHMPNVQDPWDCIIDFDAVGIVEEQNFQLLTYENSLAPLMGDSKDEAIHENGTGSKPLSLPWEATGVQAALETNNGSKPLYLSEQAMDEQAAHTTTGSKPLDISLPEQALNEQAAWEATITGCNPLFLPKQAMDEQAAVETTTGSKPLDISLPEQALNEQAAWEATTTGYNPLFLPEQATDEQAAEETTTDSKPLDISLPEQEQSAWEATITGYNSVFLPKQAMDEQSIVETTTGSKALYLPEQAIDKRVTMGNRPLCLLEQAQAAQDTTSSKPLDIALPEQATSELDTLETTTGAKPLYLSEHGMDDRAVQVSKPFCLPEQAMEQAAQVITGSEPSLPEQATDEQPAVKTATDSKSFYLLKQARDDQAVQISKPVCLLERDEQAANTGSVPLDCSLPGQATDELAELETTTGAKPLHLLEQAADDQAVQLVSKPLCLPEQAMDEQAAQVTTGSKPLDHSLPGQATGELAELETTIGGKPHYLQKQVMEEQAALYLPEQAMDKQTAQVSTGSKLSMSEQDMDDHQATTIGRKPLLLTEQAVDDQVTQGAVTGSKPQAAQMATTGSKLLVLPIPGQAMQSALGVTTGRKPRSVPKQATARKSEVAISESENGYYLGDNDFLFRLSCSQIHGGLQQIIASRLSDVVIHCIEARNGETNKVMGRPIEESQNYSEPASPWKLCFDTELSSESLTSERSNTSLCFGPNPIEEEKEMEDGEHWEEEEVFETCEKEHEEVEEGDEWEEEEVVFEMWKKNREEVEEGEEWEEEQEVIVETRENKHEEVEDPELKIPALPRSNIFGGTLQTEDFKSIVMHYHHCKWPDSFECEESGEEWSDTVPEPSCSFLALDMHSLESTSSMDETTDSMSWLQTPSEESKPVSFSEASVCSILRSEMQTSDLRSVPGDTRQLLDEVSLRLLDVTTRVSVEKLKETNERKESKEVARLEKQKEEDLERRSNMWSNTSEELVLSSSILGLYPSDPNSIAGSSVCIESSDCLESSEMEIYVPPLQKISSTTETEPGSPSLDFNSMSRSTRQLLYEVIVGLQELTADLSSSEEEWEETENEEEDEIEPLLKMHALHRSSILGGTWSDSIVGGDGAEPQHGSSTKISSCSIGSFYSGVDVNLLYSEEEWGETEIEEEVETKPLLKMHAFPRSSIFGDTLSAKEFERIVMDYHHCKWPSCFDFEESSDEWSDSTDDIDRAESPYGSSTQMLSYAETNSSASGSSYSGVEADSSSEDEWVEMENEEEAEIKPMFKMHAVPRSSIFGNSLSAREFERIVMDYHHCKWPSCFDSEESSEEWSDSIEDVDRAEPPHDSCAQMLSYAETDSSASGSGVEADSSSEEEWGEMENEEEVEIKPLFKMHAVPRSSIFGDSLSAKEFERIVMDYHHCKWPSCFDSEESSEEWSDSIEDIDRAEPPQDSCAQMLSYAETDSCASGSSYSGVEADSSSEDEWGEMENEEEVEIKSLFKMHAVPRSSIFGDSLSAKEFERIVMDYHHCKWPSCFDSEESSEEWSDSIEDVDRVEPPHDSCAQMLSYAETDSSASGPSYSGVEADSSSEDEWGEMENEEEVEIKSLFKMHAVPRSSIFGDSLSAKEFERIVMDYHHCKWPSCFDSEESSEEWSDSTDDVDRVEPPHDSCAQMLSYAETDSSASGPSYSGVEADSSSEDEWGEMENEEEVEIKSLFKMHAVPRSSIFGDSLSAKEFERIVMDYHHCKWPSCFDSEESSEEWSDSTDDVDRVEPPHESCAQMLSYAETSSCTSESFYSGMEADLSSSEEEWGEMENEEEVEIKSLFKMHAVPRSSIFGDSLSAKEFERIVMDYHHCKWPSCFDSEESSEEWSDSIEDIDRAEPPQDSCAQMLSYAETDSSASGSSYSGVEADLSSSDEEWGEMEKVETKPLLKMHILPRSNIFGNTLSGKEFESIVMHYHHCMWPSCFDSEESSEEWSDSNDDIDREPPHDSCAQMLLYEETSSCASGSFYSGMEADLSSSEEEWGETGNEDEVETKSLLKMHTLPRSSILGDTLSVKEFESTVMHYHHCKWPSCFDSEESSDEWSDSTDNINRAETSNSSSAQMLSYAETSSCTSYSDVEADSSSEDEWGEMENEEEVEIKPLFKMHAVPRSSIFGDSLSAKEFESIVMHYHHCKWPSCFDSEESSEEWNDSIDDIDREPLPDSCAQMLSYEETSCCASGSLYSGVEVDLSSSDEEWGETGNEEEVEIKSLFKMHAVPRSSIFGDSLSAKEFERIVMDYHHCKWPSCFDSEESSDEWNNSTDDVDRADLPHDSSAQMLFYAETSSCASKLFYSGVEANLSSSDEEWGEMENEEEVETYSLLKMHTLPRSNIFGNTLSGKEFESIVMHYHHCKWPSCFDSEESSEEWSDSNDDIDREPPHDSCAQMLSYEETSSCASGSFADLSPSEVEWWKTGNNEEVETKSLLKMLTLPGSNILGDTLSVKEFESVVMHYHHCKWPRCSDSEESSEEWIDSTDDRDGAEPPQGSSTQVSAHAETSSCDSGPVYSLVEADLSSLEEEWGETGNEEVQTESPQKIHALDLPKSRFFGDTLSVKEFKNSVMHYHHCKWASCSDSEESSEEWSDSTEGGAEPPYCSSTQVPSHTQLESASSKTHGQSCLVQVTSWPKFPQYVFIADDSSGDTHGHLPSFTEQIVNTSDGASFDNEDVLLCEKDPNTPSPSQVLSRDATSVEDDTLGRRSSELTDIDDIVADEFWRLAIEEYESYGDMDDGEHSDDK